MTSRQPGALPPGTTGHYWLRLLPLALLIILGLAGLRGAVATPRWDGPLHRDGVAIGIALEVVLLILLLITVRRIESGNQEAAARKLRGVLLFALGAGVVAVAVATLVGLHLHLFTPVSKRARGPAAPTATPWRPALRPGSAPGSVFHIPLADVLYALLIAALLAGLAVSLWWARRLRPSIGSREDAFIAYDSEDLREAVESGRSALRRVDRATEYVELSAVTSPDGMLAMRESLERVEVTPDLLDYIVAIVTATRHDAQVQIGASPRGGLALVQLARGQALLANRDYAIPDDIKQVAVPALAHRVTLRPELWVRQVSSDEVMAKLLSAVPTPRTDPARAVTG